MVKSKNEVNSNYGEKSRGNILIQNNDKCATNCIIPKKSTKAVFFVLLVNFIVIIAVFGSFYLSRPSEYKVTFDGNGGELLSGEAVQYVKRGESAQAPVFVKEGHTLSWDVKFEDLKNDIAVTAIWIPNEYNVTFNGNGGELVSGEEEQSIKYGNAATPPVYVKEGYDLSWDSDWEHIKSDITIKAVWTIRILDVVFDAAGADPILAQQKEYGTLVSEPAQPEKGGCIFQGWYDNSDYEGEPYDFSAPVRSDLTLYAKWQPVTYTINFITNGGAPVASVTRDFGAQLNLPSTTKKGHEFLGWTKEDMSAFAYTTMPALDGDTLTLYAEWETLSYNVTFIAQGVDDYVLYVAFGAHILEPSSPIRRGHVFAGWYADDTFVTPFDFAGFFMSDEAVSIYGKWIAIQYTATYICDNETLAAYTGNYGDSLTPPTEPSREGYTFMGWFADRYYMTQIDFDTYTLPDQDVNIYAYLAINTYTVTFKLAGKEDYDTTVDWNSAAQAPDWTKDGYDLIWDPADFSAVTGDMTINGHWQLRPGATSDLKSIWLAKKDLLEELWGENNVEFDEANQMIKIYGFPVAAECAYEEIDASITQLETLYSTPQREYYNVTDTNMIFVKEAFAFEYIVNEEVDKNETYYEGSASYIYTVKEGEILIRFLGTLNQVEIPDTVKTINYGAFANNYVLIKISYPQGLEKIGDYAFAYCSFLDRTLPDGAQIGYEVFYGCDPLT
ncbi:MAG: InlB B-repeat-containing protein [Christensenellales bacterium]|jgi:uncharacterized repeat protein (TIGR02543 family)